ncbi:anoctamin-3-like isoform X3 [Mustela lutreola]|uniref:anoctamin-3-like isoform X3 n=1 Tax=Mustela lutreola TaxID=9666 RepID=UPI0027977A92|nr:anoctamin-3-like isoform X3 [Mustela lutreola]
MPSAACQVRNSTSQNSQKPQGMLGRAQTRDHHSRFPCESWRPEAEQGNLTLFYWKLLALRLGFIVAFEHVVFVRLLVWLVPDVPAALVTKIKRERCLVVQEPADNREQGHCPQSPGPGASEAERSFKNPGLS